MLDHVIDASTKLSSYQIWCMNYRIDYTVPYQGPTRVNIKFVKLYRRLNQASFLLYKALVLTCLVREAQRALVVPPQLPDLAN